jgi:hypothetical protein
MTVGRVDMGREDDTGRCGGAGDQREPELVSPHPIGTCLNRATAGRARDSAADAREEGAARRLGHRCYEESLTDAYLRFPAAHR